MRPKNRHHGLGLAKRQPQLADASGSTWSATGPSGYGTSQWSADTSLAGTGQWAGSGAGTGTAATAGTAAGTTGETAASAAGTGAGTGAATSDGTGASGATAPVAAADGTTAAGTAAGGTTWSGTAEGTTGQWTGAPATDTTTQATTDTSVAGAGTAGAAAAAAAPAAAQDSTAAGTANTWEAAPSEAAATGDAAAGTSATSSTEPTTQLSAEGSTAEPPTAAGVAPVVGATTFATAVIPTATDSSKSLPSSFTPTTSEATATSTVLSVDSAKNVGEPAGTKAAIGLSVIIVVAAMAGLILWSLRRKKRRLREIIANSRGEKVPESPRASDEFVRYASKFCTEGASVMRQAGGKIKATYQSKIPILQRHFENAKYEPIKEFSRKVYSASVSTLQKVGGFVHSSWAGKAHVPRPYSTYSTYSTNSLQNGLRDLPRSCHTKELAPVVEVNESIESPTESSETLVGDVGRLKDAAVSSTPKLETGKFPEAKVATVETVTPVTAGSSSSSSPSSSSSSPSSSRDSSPSVSRSPTVDRVSRSPTVESRTYPGTPDISFARVFRVEMDFKPVSPEHVELKEGQTAVLHLVYDDGWALVNVLETAQEGLVPRACFGAYPVRHQALYMGSNLQISTDGVPRSISSATPTEYGSDGDIGRFYSQCASPDLPTAASLHETLPRPQRLKSLPSLASLFRSASSFKSMV